LTSIARPTKIACHFADKNIVPFNNQTNIVIVSEERQRELQAVRQRIFRKVRE
jgi:hypothetical protein